MPSTVGDPATVPMENPVQNSGHHALLPSHIWLSKDISAVGMTSELEGGGFIFHGFSKAITDVDRSIATSNILSKEWQIRPEHLELVEYICRGNNNGTVVFKGRFRGSMMVAAKRFFVGPAADTSPLNNQDAPTLMQIKREVSYEVQQR